MGPQQCIGLGPLQLVTVCVARLPLSYYGHELLWPWTNTLWETVPSSKSLKSKQTMSGRGKRPQKVAEWEIEFRSPDSQSSTPSTRQRHLLNIYNTRTVGASAIYHNPFILFLMGFSVHVPPCCYPSPFEWVLRVTSSLTAVIPTDRMWEEMYNLYTAKRNHERICQNNMKAVSGIP